MQHRFFSGRTQSAHETRLECGDQSWTLYGSWVSRRCCMIRPALRHCQYSGSWPEPRAEGPFYTSLGQRPRIHAIPKRDGRAESPPYNRLWSGPSALVSLSNPLSWGVAPGWYGARLRRLFMRSNESRFPRQVGDTPRPHVYRAEIRVRSRTSRRTPNPPFSRGDSGFRLLASLVLLKLIQVSILLDNRLGFDPGKP